jgi:hypothetical protein
MTMKKMLVVLCSLCALSGSVTTRAQSLLAHEPTQAGPAAAIGELQLFASNTIPLQGEVVKGMPYSAEIVTESVQTLADGNRIVQRKTGRVYRDGQGRMRREDDLPSGGSTVSITDPVAGTAFTLDPATRTARESPVLTLKPALGSLDWTIRPRQGSVQPLTFYVWTYQQGQPMFATEAAGGRGGRGSAAGDMTEEKLADRVMEGVLATGVRRTTTIAKGAIGNELPIKIVAEEWRSPDLQILVMTDHMDPRTGRSTYRLLKISKLEPDAALFQVPSDYTIQRQPAKGRGRGGQ